MERIQRVLSHLRAMLRPTQNPNRSTEQELSVRKAPPLQEQAFLDITVPKTAVEQPEVMNCYTKASIDSARCDLHPLYLIREMTIETLSANSTDSTMVKASSCTKANCNRHYIPEFGYFPFVAGDNLNAGDMQAKLRCDKRELAYMVVTRFNGGEFVWACPEARCTHSIAYQEP
jgi:hypothetical protein